ncbi:hypothetical protein NQ652_18125, partial [Acinetobacter baumannii]|nr:hypothetical protein [Acinetobacter baumannii]
IGLAAKLVDIDSITTKTDINGNSSVLSSKGFKITGRDSKETAISLDAIEINNKTDRSKLTPQGLEINDGSITAIREKQKNVLNKESITIMDTREENGVSKNDTNTIKASSSEIKNKEGYSVKITADKISVSKGTDKVAITKASLMGATTIGKDGNNSLIFGNG